ncbi:hypothetical protein ACFSKW_45385 [Nonomuraea mangrovi]|uniref:Uncharacterized protein n=1 Tax=Nonomuraea mangrovi TaxID=2316207 RepID=A0ABW4TC99_9ACTN
MRRYFVGNFFVATGTPPDRLLPVDLLAYTADVWRARFSPDRVGDESWGYAFLDGVVLDDPDGVVAQLRTDAAEIHAHYRVPAHIRAHYAGLWKHLRPKSLALLRTIPEKADQVRNRKKRGSPPKFDKSGCDQHSRQALLVG